MDDKTRKPRIRSECYIGIESRTLRAKFSDPIGKDVNSRHFTADADGNIREDIDGRVSYASKDNLVASLRASPGEDMSDELQALMEIEMQETQHARNRPDDFIENDDFSPS